MAGAWQQYFVEARWSTAALAANWSDFLPAGVACAGLAALVAAAGGRAARWLGLSRAGRFTDTGFGFGLGLAAAGSLVMGAGLAGLLFVPPRFVTLTALALAGIVGVVRGRAALRRRASWSPMARGGTAWPVRLLLLAALGMALIGVLNIEMAWDALSYHLRLPAFYAYRHKIYDVWHHYCAAFPSQVEMLFLLGRLVHGDTLARLLNALCGLALLPATAGLARDLGLIGRVATALLAATPTYLLLLNRAYIDPGFALFVTLALRGLVQFLATGRRAPLAVSGLLAGAAMGSKYVGVLVLPAALAAAVPVLRRAAGRRAAVLWCAAAFLPLLPWLAKNWLLKGNPVSPLLGGLFGTHEELPGDVTPIFSGDHPLATLAASLPRRAMSLLVDQGQIDGPQAAALVGLFPLLLLTRPASPARAALRRAVLAWTAGWFLLAPDARFFLPALPAAAVALEGVWPATGAGAWLFEAGLASGAAYALTILWVFFAPFSMVLGLDSAEARHTLSLPPPPFASYMKTWINDRTPPDERIWFMAHFSTYYVERECLAEFHFGRSQFARLVDRAPDAPAMARRFRQLGFRYLLSTGTQAQQYTWNPRFFSLPDAGWRAFKHLLATRAEVAWQSEYYVLYRLGKIHAAKPLPALPLYEAIVFQHADEALADGRAAEALRDYASPPPLLADVGSTFQRQGDAWLVLAESRRAETAFRRALELGADNPRTRVGLGEALERQGRSAEALPHHEAAWRQHPRSAFVAAALALNYAHLDRRADARRLIAAAVALRPDEADYRKIAAELK